MKNFLVLAVLMTAGTTATYAAAACLTSDTLTNYIGFGATGCEIGDKVFANFVYTPTGTDPLSGSVVVGVDDNVGISQFGLQFQSNTTVWTSSFSLSYTVTIDQAACAAIYGAGVTCTITAEQGAFQGALAPNAATLSIVTTSGTISLDDVSTGDNVKQIAKAAGPPWVGPGATSESVAMTGTAVTGSPIDTFGLDEYQTAVPEPATFSLVGGALLGLGFLGRKKISRQ